MTSQPHQRPTAEPTHRPGLRRGRVLPVASGPGQLLDTLAPPLREAFVATQVHGLTYAQAAQVCGCTVATIRTRVAQARTILVHAHRQTGTTPRPHRDA